MILDYWYDLGDKGQGQKQISDYAVSVHICNGPPSIDPILV